MTFTLETSPDIVKLEFTESDSSVFSPLKGINEKVIVKISKARRLNAYKSFADIFDERTTLEPFTIKHINDTFEYYQNAIISKKLRALNDIFGILSDLSSDDLEKFDKAIKRRPLFE